MAVTSQTLYSPAEQLRGVSNITNRVHDPIVRALLAELVYQSQWLDSDAVVAARDKGILP